MNLKITNQNATQNEAKIVQNIAKDIPDLEIDVS